MNLGTKLSDFWRRFQGELFPALTEEVGHRIPPSGRVTERALPLEPPGVDGNGNG